jgi:hypothetical protein
MELGLPGVVIVFMAFYAVKARQGDFLMACRTPDFHPGGLFI